MIVQKTTISKDYLHGMTLEKILNFLVAELGWEDLGISVRIKCFTNTPSISSSLKFLRRTPWARKAVEELYVSIARDIEREKADEERLQKL